MSFISNILFYKNPEQPNHQRIPTNNPSFLSSLYTKCFRRDGKLSEIESLNQTLASLCAKVTDNQDSDTQADCKRVVFANCKTLSKAAPAILRKSQYELETIKYHYAQAQSHPRENSELINQLSEKQRTLQDQISKTYALFGQFREILRVDKNKAETFADAHRELSIALGQKSDDPASVITSESAPISNLTTARLLIFDEHFRSKIRGVFAILARCFIDSTKTAFSSMILRKVNCTNPTPLHKAKALIANHIASAGIHYGWLLFGADLLTGSRNVTKLQVTLSQEDLQFGQNLVKKLNDNRIRLPGSQPGESIKIEEHEHISSGICSGTSLELLIQHLKNNDKSMRDVAGLFATGSTPAAHANQACYEAITCDVCDEIFDSTYKNQLQYALNKENGIGVFKADYHHVMTLLNHFETTGSLGSRNDDSLISKALQQSYQKVGGLVTHQSANRKKIHSTRDTKQLKEAVLESLNTLSNADPSALEIAKNELEWWIALLELRTLMHMAYGRIQIDAFTTEKGTFTKESPTQSIWDRVSNDTLKNCISSLVREERSFARIRAVAQGRGVDLVSIDNVVGVSFAMRNDDEYLERVNADLSNGHYMVGIELNGSAHALAYYKNDQEEYLFDPNFGLIDCSGGRLKEQFKRLLSFYVYAAPKRDEQGPNSEGTSHNIRFNEVKSSRLFNDLLSDHDLQTSQGLLNSRSG